MDAIREQMKEYGVEFIIDENFKIDGPILKVECDIDINLGLDWVNDCLLRKVTKRGTDFYCSFKQSEERLVMSFFTKIPTNMPSFLNDTNYLIATTFVDMCWLYSDGTTNQSAEEVATEFRKGDDIILGDLTWALPSKFVDDFVEMVHTINPDFMSGLMQDCVVYGPYKMDNYSK